MGNYFIHIPRTGGNAIGRVLPIKYYTYLGHDLRDPNYRHPSEICKPSDFVFTFVRNPYDRIISAFHYLDNGGNNAHDAFDAYLLGIKKLSFEGFINHKLKDASNWQIHFIPQSFYLTGVQKYSFYKYEQLETGFAEVCKILGAENIKLQTQKINRSKKNGLTQDYFDKKTTKIVRQIYKDDFKIFGFPDKIPY